MTRRVGGDSELQNSIWGVQWGKGWLALRNVLEPKYSCDGLPNTGRYLLLVYIR